MIIVIWSRSVCNAYVFFRRDVKDALNIQETLTFNLMESGELSDGCHIVDITSLG